MSKTKNWGDLSEREQQRFREIQSEICQLSDLIDRARIMIERAKIKQKELDTEAKRIWGESPKYEKASGYA